MPSNQTPSCLSSPGLSQSPTTVTALTLFDPTNKNEQPEYKQAVNLLNYTIEKLKSVKPEHSYMDRLLQDISRGFFKKVPRREAYRLAFDNAINNLETLKSKLSENHEHITAKQIEDTVVSNLDQCLGVLNAHKSTETLGKFSYYFPQFIDFDNKIKLPLLRQYQKKEQEKASDTYVSFRDL